MFTGGRGNASKILAVIVMILGGGFRLALYWQRPSLWNDEVYVALNVITRPLSELFGRLEFEQSAPLGFLWLERLSVALFGASEYGMRAIPLVCGLASLPLAWCTARKFVGVSAALLMTSAIAFSSCAVFFSNAVKPYEIDLFVTLVLLFMAGRRNRPWGWALAGTLALSWSMPAIFVLAGIWLQEAVAAFRRKAAAEFWNSWLLVGVCWAALFLLLFWLIYAPVANDNFMKHYWAPASFQAQGDLAAIGKLILSGTLGGAFGLNVGSGLGAEGGSFPVALMTATAALFLVGLFRAPLAVSVSFALTLIGAALGKWVFADRLMLFYLPAAALAMACGMDWLFHFLRWRWLSLALVVLLAALPVKYCVWVVRHPEREALRETVQFVTSQMPALGSVYCYNKSVPAWLFYTTDWRFPDVERVQWIMSALQALDDNRRRAEPPAGGVPHQGVARAWKGGWELIGAPDGILVTTLGREPMAPRDGWVNDECALIRTRARGSLALVGIASGLRGLPDLEKKLVGEGAQPIDERVTRGASVDFLRLPSDWSR